MTVTEKLASLLSAANAKTGENDTDLTAAIEELIDGFGSGGGETYVGVIVEAASTPGTFPLSSLGSGMYRASCPSYTDGRNVTKMYFALTGRGNGATLIYSPRGGWNALGEIASSQIFNGSSSFRFSEGRAHDVYKVGEVDA